jgi:hypothetical protein
MRKDLTHLFGGGADVALLAHRIDLRALMQRHQRLAQALDHVFEVAIGCGIDFLLLQ